MDDLRLRDRFDSVRRRTGFLDLVVLIGAVAWIVAVRVASPEMSQTVSNFGLAAAALVAAAVCVHTALTIRGLAAPRIRRFWWTLGASAFSWGLGQVMWTIYESVLGQSLPFPSLADVGYLLAVPLVAVALLSLPSGAQGLAGRMRTVLDGAIIATALLVVSWTLVLNTLLDPASNTLLEQVISLAYPVGDIVSVTILAYVILRARDTQTRPPVPMTLISAALLAIAIADSGFAVLTASDAYASGSIIDIGWFLGYILIFVAARVSRVNIIGAGASERPGILSAEPGEDSPMALLMPYGALLLSALVSIIDVARNGEIGVLVSVMRTVLLLLIILRQVLATRELDITRRHVRERTAELSGIRRRFEALALHSSDVVMVVDVRSRMEYVSGSIRTVFDHDADDLLGTPLVDLVAEGSKDILTGALGQAASETQGSRTVEVQIGSGTGFTWAEMTITNLLDNDDVVGLIINCHDVSERKTLEDQLVHLAFHDSLTALANRSLFKEHVEEALVHDPGRNHVGVLFLDLDGFKQVNDSLGHAAGDLLLVMVAERLRTSVREADVIARLGGDEFAVLLTDASSDGVALSVAERITGALEAPFLVDGQEVRVRGSIGISRTIGHQTTGDELLRNADLAMYRAKSTPGNAVEVFHPRMHENLIQRFHTERAMRSALSSGEFVLHYQPTIDLRSGDVTGVEALVRWQHPERGLIGPGEFIPIAEATGFIRDIGRFVIREACRQAAEWRDAVPAFASLGMSVNLSAKEVQQTGLVSQVQQALRESGLPPGLLTLEMTESVLFEHNEEWLSALKRLRDLGIRLAIDDFGTGYSSLAYLHRFPADVLKIDRSFVERMSGPNPDDELVNTIIRLGQSLRMTTVAEGVEDATQVEMLTQLGCDLGQGFHLARPMPADEVLAFVQAQATSGPKPVIDVTALEDTGIA